MKKNRNKNGMLTLCIYISLHDTPYSHIQCIHAGRGGEIHIRDRGSDLYVGIDMVKNYCLYKWYGRCSAKKGQKL